jgi:hypothetical protein
MSESQCMFCLETDTDCVAIPDRPCRFDMSCEFLCTIERAQKEENEMVVTEFGQYFVQFYEASQIIW